MRKLVLGAVLLGSTAFASAATTTCISNEYGEHTVTVERDRVSMHDRIFTLRDTAKLPSGASLYIFTYQPSGKNPLVLGLSPNSEGKTDYILMSGNKKTLDEGVCN